LGETSKKTVALSKTNILYTVLAPLVAQSPGPSPPSHSHSLTGLQDQHSLYCSSYSHWLAQSPGPSPSSPCIRTIVPHSLTGLQDQYSLHCSPYSCWFAQSPGPSLPCPYIRTIVTHSLTGLQDLDGHILYQCISISRINKNE
jgi:hypothetical protein